MDRACVTVECLSKALGSGGVGGMEGTATNVHAKLLHSLLQDVILVW